MIRRFSKLLLRFTSPTPPVLQTRYLNDPEFCHRSDPLCADALQFIESSRADQPLAVRIQRYTFPFYQAAALFELPRDKTFPEQWVPLAFLAGIYTARENRNLVKSLLQEDPRFEALADEATRVCQLFVHEFDSEENLIPFFKLQKIFAHLTRQSFTASPKTPIPTQIRASCELVIRIGFLAGLRQDTLTARLLRTIQTCSPHQQLLITAIVNGQALPLAELKKHPLLRLCRSLFSSHKNHAICLENVLLQLMNSKTIGSGRDTRRWSQEAFLAGESLNQTKPDMTYFLIEEWGAEKTEHFAELLQLLETESKVRNQPISLIRSLHFPAPNGNRGEWFDHLLHVTETSFALGLIQSLRDHGNRHRLPRSIKDLEPLWKRRSK